MLTKVKKIFLYTIFQQLYSSVTYDFDIFTAEQRADNNS